MRQIPLSKELSDLVGLLPKHVVFGPGARHILHEQLLEKKVLIICSPRGKSQFLSDSALREAIEVSESFEFLEVVNSNPSLESIQAVGDQSVVVGADLLIGFGGGSAIDFAKSLSAIDPNSTDHSNLLQLIQLQPAITPLVPVIAVPTTSGTGAEVTSFASVWSHGAQKKLSLSHPNLKPSLALVDPELSHSAPTSVTLETGLDALNQALESIWNKNRTAESFQYASSSIALILPSLSAAVNNGRDSQARINLSLGSTLAGLAINLTKTSICHSISYPLTARFGVPHGLACAFSMKAVMKIVRDAHPEILDDLAGSTGFHNADGLINGINAVIADHRVHEQVQARVGDLSRLVDLIAEMYTPGRSDTFIETVTDSLIANILLESAAE